MVIIKDYALRENSLGETFYALLVQGGIEVVKSKESGRNYITAKTASVPSTFPEEVCKNLTEPGNSCPIKKVECEPYEITDQETGEVRQLNFRYEYIQEGETVDEVIHEDQVQSMSN